VWLQRVLIAPAAGIGEASERRRVRLLSGLTLFAAGALSSGAAVAGVPSLVGGALLAWLAYGLSRTVRYRLGVLAVLVALELPSVVFVLNAPALSDVDFYASYIWLGVPLVLTSFWLLPGYTGALTVLNVVIVALTPLVQPSVGDTSVIILSGYVATVGGLAVLAGVIQAQNMRRIETQAAQLTEQNRMLSAARAEALEANQLKSEFLSNISHELRTPLNAVLGFSELLLEGVKGDMPPPQQDYVERIQRNGDSLLRLVNDVLDINKLEARRMGVRPEPVTVRPFFEGVAEQVEPLADNLAFGVVIAEDMPGVVTVDRAHLERVVLNLLSNAFKFTKEGAVRLEVAPVEGGRWAFRVSDTGVGIAPHARDAIFEPFRQVDGSFTRMYGGTGLGLAIVQQLVTLMGGYITVESELGEGSVFRVELPVNAPQAAVGGG
jgi:signal transduction histidine kinase